MISTGCGGGGRGEGVPGGASVRKTDGLNRCATRVIGPEQPRGENSALLNQRTPGGDWPGHCRAGADQRRGSEPPMCAPPGTPFARGERQAGGGADLCVRSAGFGSEENCSMGSSKTWIGPSHVHPTENTLRKGRETGRRGGGPLCPLRWDWIGREEFQRAAQRHGSANNLFPASCHLPPSSGKHHPAQTCSPGTFFHGS